MTAEQIERRYPFKNLPKEWIGLFAPDNGVINVQLLLRTLSRLAKDYGADAQQHIKVKQLHPHGEDGLTWKVSGLKKESQSVEFHGKKIILTCGAYINHVVEPNFGFQLDLNIWEMVASYFSVNPGPGGTVFPSKWRQERFEDTQRLQRILTSETGMWFQFAPDKDGRSQLFYGFPTLDWGPPNVARIAVDAATRQIRDPDERLTSVVNAKDIEDTQDYIKEHIVGVDSTVPAFTLSCLQTNVFGTYKHHV